MAIQRTAAALSVIFWVICVMSVDLLATERAEAAGVQVTPLGSHDGEFCRFDRAMIF